MRLADGSARSSVRRRGLAGVFGLAAVLAAPLLAAHAGAAVVVADCTTACELKNGQTHINFPDEMVVITGLITPLPGSTTVRVFAREIVVDGSLGGAITVTGKGRSIELKASRLVLVTGDLLSSNSNGKIIVTAVDMVQIDRASLESGGNMEIECTGADCPLNLLRVRLRANRIFVDARGDIFWDGNRIDTFGPRDMVEIESRTGSIRKSGAISVALRSGRLVTAPQGGRVDAASEAAAFCATCLEPTPTTTPPGATPTPTVFATATLPAEFSPTPTPAPPTPTPTDLATPEPTPTPDETPEASATPPGTPEATATPLDGGTATPTAAPTPAPTTTATATAVVTPTATLLATPTATATPAPTPTPSECNEIIGGVESALIVRAAGDIDAHCDRYVIARDITIVAGGSVDLTGAEVRNDFGKCGDIVITGPTRVSIERAILVDDDCQNRPDVSRINGREEVPHTGFNNVVGTPLIDD